VCNSIKGIEWLTKHKCENNADSVGLNQNNKFYNSKVVMPISTSTISTIIKSLPKHWLSKHKCENVPDSKGLNQKNIFITVK